MLRTLKQAPRSFGKSLDLISITNAICLATSLSVAVIIRLQNGGVAPPGLSSNTADPSLFKPQLATLAMIAVAVFIEELLFRLLPFLIVFAPLRLILGKDRDRYNRWFFLPIFALSAALFGYVHGNIYNVFIQGVTGFFYSLLFLKASGADLKFVQGFHHAFIAHLLFDYFLILLIWIQLGIQSS